MTASPDPSRLRKTLAACALLSSLCAVVGAVWLLLLPADPKNALLFGLSASRVALLSGLLVSAALETFAARALWMGSLGAFRFLSSLERWLGSPARLYFTELALLAAALAGAAVLAVAPPVPGWEAILLRLSPLAFSLIGTAAPSFLAVAWLFGGPLTASPRLRAAVHSVDVFFFAAGLLLVALNLYGLPRSMRNPEIYRDLYWTIELTPEEVYAALPQRTGESNAEYMVRLVDALHWGIAHYWEPAGTDRYHLRVPVWENWILFLGSYLNPDRYLAYEFCAPRPAIERGVGLCSQVSLTIADILAARGFNVQIAGLDGHVVAQAEVAPGEWWTLDVDHGIVLKEPIEAIQQHPEVIVPLLIAQGYTEPEYLAHMVEVWGPEGNFVTANAGDDFEEGRCTRERWFYALKWLLPLLALCPALITFARRRRIVGTGSESGN
ncbi:MAG: hypothetical protein HYZ26_06265 [Chloroflexi bacterium]|nr:hypothetical protein [Chloroflexota bacterium]